MVSKLSTDAVHWFMSDLTSRIVAQSGLPADRFHLGKIILQSFKDYPDAVMQIDGGTGESETNGSIMERTVKCATAFRNLGLTTGDVMVLMAPNHIDLSVPFYAGLYTGVIIAAVDRTLGVKELQDSFNVSRPKIIFCQSEKAPDIQVALNEIDLNALIVTFDKGDYLCNYADFVAKYADDTPIQEFKPTDFDPSTTTGFLISTSGTTGLPKAAEVTHKNFVISIPMFWIHFNTFPTPTRMSLVGAPLQWLTALFQFIASPIFKYTRLQTSIAVTPEHAYYLINEYRPTFTILSPTLMATLIKKEARDQCDLTCFEIILLGGSSVPTTLVDDIKSITPNTEVVNIYGMSEVAGIAFSNEFPPPGSCGKPMKCFEYRLIDVDTQEDIAEPNTPGELWLKGPSIFKGYYDNAEATEEAFVDGWFKTGDMFYRDENWNFFFLERIKLLLKYKSYQISPVEVENVIRQHPGVLDVAVTGIPDAECGDLPIACVVTRDGYDVSVDEIKNLVKDSLSDSKQLRGGVIFLNSIPMTASTKVHRRQLKELVLNLERQ
ncbi:luciferin 4-monooxygenase isoform X1 [Bicyclus anynana]|uniref:Luciferin 4-monooxygenase isoform X1 n=1 Tax=Bicyclus anynana TaxID=110368 RepID=A0A6J1MUN8_BICAN|nr:luciferin 4-monooxygenase isoform X1 [Bicyclus anynana]